MKHQSRSGILKQLAVLSIVSWDLSIYITFVGGTRDLASTNITEVTVRSEKWVREAKRGPKGSEPYQWHRQII